MPKESVFFICGPQRSGTTLLADLLSQHRDIHLPKDAIGFRLVNSFTNYKEVLPFNTKYSWAELQSWIIDNDYKGRVKSFIPIETISKYQNARELLSDSIQKLLKEKNKNVLGDKTPNMEFHVEAALSLLPDAKFIHLVRDGRSVAASIRGRAGKNLRLAAHHWVEANALGLYHEAILGKEKYKVIKYEDLLQKPDEVLRELCDFLNLKYSPEMLKPSEHSKNKDSYVKSFLDTSKVGAYKKTLSRSKIRMLEKVQGSLLEKFGYKLEEVEEPPTYQKITFSSFIACHLAEAFQQLFHAEHEGMRGRKNVAVKIPFFLRCRNFLLRICFLFLPRFLMERIQKKRVVKQLIYAPGDDPKTYE